MPDLFTTYTRKEDMPSLSAIIEEARRQREGPPIDPRAAAYEHVLLIARSMLWREAPRRKRNEVIEEFDKRAARFEEALDGHESLGSQLAALERAIGDADLGGFDRRSHRESKAPEGESLLSEYETLLPTVKRIFGEQPRPEISKLIEHLLVAFPSLTQDQVAEAAHDKPSWGAYTILGVNHDLSPSSIRDLLTAARRAQNKQKSQ